MSKQKLTDWYPASVKPVRKGWYQTRIATSRGPGYSRFWNGRWWSCYDMRGERSATQCWDWRGLAEEPKQ